MPDLKGVMLLESDRLVALAALAVVVGAFFIYAVPLAPELIGQARLVLADSRDASVKAALAQRKKALEMLNNELGYYPLDFAVDPYAYVITEQAKQQVLSWYLSAPLVSTNLDEEHGFDEQVGRHYLYRIIKRDGSFYYEICGGEEACLLMP